MEQYIETAVAVRAADVYKDFTHYTIVGYTGDFNFIPARRTETAWILGEESKSFKTLRAAIAAAEETGLKSAYNLGQDGDRFMPFLPNFSASTNAEHRLLEELGWWKNIGEEGRIRDKAIKAIKKLKGKKALCFKDEGTLDAPCSPDDGQTIGPLWLSIGAGAEGAEDYHLSHNGDSYFTLREAREIARQLSATLTEG